MISILIENQYVTIDVLMTLTHISVEIRVKSSNILYSRNFFPIRWLIGSLNLKEEENDKN